MPELNASELAKTVGGELVGNEQVTICDALPLREATAQSVSFIEDVKYSEQLKECPAAILFVPKDKLEEIREADEKSRAYISVDCVHDAMRTVIPELRKIYSEQTTGVHHSANVAATSKVGPGTTIAAGVNIGEDCEIGANCTIHSGVQIMAGCKIADECVIYPNVTLYPSTVLAERVTLHAGCVLGANGFGYQTVEGKHVPAAQLGWVIVEADVEIGANTCIDRGAYGATRIEAGTKIDNLVQIGHNVRVGQHNLICSQVGIAGSSSSDEYVILAGQVGIADHIHLNRKVVVGAQSGVMRDAPEGEVLFGSPAAARRAKMSEIASIMRIPNLRKQLKQLEAKVKELQNELTSADDDKKRNAA